jgi:dinuclear metal center YbgI/SA1388 family protein
MARLSELVSYLDELLGTAETPDYGNALNGLQLENSGEVGSIAAAVDFSRATVAAAVAGHAGMLIVHHGMFWPGLRPIRDASYARLRSLIEHDVAVYASHLPLDRHPTFGNNALLAAALGLVPSGEFARFETISVGVRGDADLEMPVLVERARVFARQHGGEVRAAINHDRVRHWGICTGAGASSATIAEAKERGLDTLIVGEGPHHTAVEAADDGLTIIYAGHYATETLGVSAIGEHLSTRFGIPWMFLEGPTGL